MEGGIGQASRAKTSSLRNGWALALRALTALVGGYAAAAGLASLIARFLPIARVEATAWGMLLSFAIYVGLALWAFAEVKLWRVFAVIWGTAAVSAGLVLLAGVRP